MWQFHCQLTEAVRHSNTVICSCTSQPSSSRKNPKQKLQLTGMRN